MDNCENLVGVEISGELGRVYVLADGTRHYALGHRVLVGRGRRILCTLCCDVAKKYDYVTSGWGEQ